MPKILKAVAFKNMMVISHEEKLSLDYRPLNSKDICVDNEALYDSRITSLLIQSFFFSTN